MSDPDPGVPEALPATLRLVRERLGVGAVDRVWLFPPLTRGRRESGLVAVAVTVPEDDRRRLYTARYVAERTGRTLTVEPELVEEGLAPTDRLPRVMDGVVRRSGMELGDPREVEIRGDVEVFQALLEELEGAQATEAQDP